MSKIFIFKKENKNFSEDGFTLIEVVVAIAIFSLIIGGVVTFSINSVKASTKSQAMQETVDNARYVMNDLSKKVRTSSNVILSDGNKALFFVDNLTATKYCYQFVENGSNESKMVLKSFKLKLNDSTNLPINLDEYKTVKDCSSSKFTNTAIGGGGPPVDLIGSSKTSVTGHFEVLTTDVSSDNPHRGFVRIVVDIYYKKGLESGEPADSAEAHIQTGVSILDYTREEGVFN